VSEAEGDSGESRPLGESGTEEAVSLVENLEFRHPDPRHGPRIGIVPNRSDGLLDGKRSGQVHESGAVGRVRLVALDERMVVELAPDGRA
jgi:hypothetical protein